MLAFDKSARTMTVDGSLRVEMANISKANVCPYMGREIPDFEELGLDADTEYKLLRDPDELAKAASSFNGLQVLIQHVPVSADDHQPDITVGSTGTHAVFEAPYLRNNLTIWSQEAIDAINDDSRRQLSPAYRYTADMTSGVHEGLRYDGIMRNIVGNHVALVEVGRTGPDVIVGDSGGAGTVMLKSRKALMVSGALAAHMRPKLAADAKVDFRGALDGVTAENFSAKRPAILAAVKRLTKGKLAQDADVSDVVGLLDALEDVTDGEVDSDMVETAAEATDTDEDKPAVDADGDDMAEVMAFLKGKLSDEDMATISKMLGDGAEPAGPAAEDDKPAGVSKPAMDAAIASALVVARREAAAIRQAEQDVEPFIGKLAVAQDSAAKVYKLALDSAKVVTKGVPPEAYGALLRALPKPGAHTARPDARIAQDAASGAEAWLDGLLKPAKAA